MSEAAAIVGGMAIPDDFFEKLELAWKAHRGEKPKVTLGPKVCAHCEDGLNLEHGTGVLVTMLPGFNGVVWYLCVQHWNEGYEAPVKDPA